MKLLEINVSSGMLSTGRICTDIAQSFKEAGNEVCIAFGRDNYYRGIQTYSVSTLPDILVDAFKTRLLDNAGFNNKRRTKKLVKWIKEYNPDIIHLHNLIGYYVNVEELFKYLKTCNKKIIWTLHDCWCFTGHCSYFNDCEGWLSGCKKCYKKSSYPKSILMNRSQKNFDKKKSLFTGINNLTLVTPSEWLANLVKRSFMKEYPIKVINNGINLENFKKTYGCIREKYNLKNKKIVLGVASPWIKRKGYDDFITLSNKLDDDYQIVMIGLNKQQIKKIPSNIIGLTRTDSVTELAEWYSTADVFVNATYEDNYPTVNLEAQACGTPTITYNTGGSVESVPKENVVPQGDIDELIKKIKEICIKGSKIFKPYGISDMVNEYIKLYLE